MANNETATTNPSGRYTLRIKGPLQEMETFYIASDDLDELLKARDEIWEKVHGVKAP